jgi:hypothetical protein
MTSRVTTPQYPLTATQHFRVTTLAGRRGGWPYLLPPLLPVVRGFARGYAEPQHLARERRIAAQERLWLRLSSMSDGQVVGLEPRAPLRATGSSRRTHED